MLLKHRRSEALVINIADGFIGPLRFVTSAARGRSPQCPQLQLPLSNSIQTLPVSELILPRQITILR
jgi:hypothetical protein